MALPTLTEPVRLWWLLVLPVVWWLAQLPRPRGRLITAHLRQWRAARNALKRRPVRQRRLRTWLLLLAVSCAVVAHAGPRTPERPGPRRLAVVLDGSASMLAREGGTDAWQQATGALRAVLASLPATVDVRVLRLGGTMQRLAGVAARELRGLAPPWGLRGVDLAALAVAIDDPDTALWTLTDGQGGALPDQGALSVFGGPLHNWAITAVQIEDRWPLPGLLLQATVASFARTPAEVHLSVDGAVEPTAGLLVTLAPGQRREVPFLVQRTAPGGRLELHLAAAGDPLPADDSWAFQLPALPAPRIAVLAAAEAGPAIRVAALALAAEVRGSVVDATAGGSAAFLLVEGGEVDLVPGGTRALLFGARLRGGPPAQPWGAPGALQWDRADPLTAGLDLSELRVRQAWRGILPSGRVVVWAEAPGGAREALITLVEGQPPGSLATLHCAFRLQDSNLPLLAAFPQLLRRALLAAYGSAARIVPDPGNLGAAPGDGGESDLRRRGGAVSRPVPAFGDRGHSLAAWCLALALLALALRSWVR